MRTVTPLLPLLSLVTACAIGGDADDPTSTSALSGTAQINLSSSSVRVTQTGDNEWELDKTGSLSGNTVTWNITATNTATTSGQLVLQGTMKVSNTGTGPGTIGNIVVNLQTKAGTGNSWTSRSADIADATNGDDATTTSIHKAASSENRATFTENAASGELEFMDASNNTVFSLVPQKTIGAGESVTLLFQASFDNNVLDIPVGTTIRAEVIVSFGNATTNGNSTANVDINGNGQIDSDEARIRSVPSRITVQMPAPVNGNATPTLSDTIDDITATGSVTFSNVQINLGSTSGTVTATVDGGATGGSITNCAHLTTPSITVNSGGFIFPMIDGLDLESCSTVTVGAVDPPCTPGAPGCGWTPGDLVTHSQVQYGGSPTSSVAAALLNSNFGIYSSFFEIGLPANTGFSIVFTNVASLLVYLPSNGTAAPLNNDLLNPTASASGVFGGDVAALRLNVDFSDRDITGGAAGVVFGDLSVCDVTTTGLTGLNGQTVRDVLAIANSALGGSSTGLPLAELSVFVADLNASFLGGSVSTVAQNNLVNGPCP